MRKTLNKYLFIILPVLVLYGALLTLLFTKTNYSVTAPGYNDNIEQTIYVEMIEDAIQEGSFHTTSVIALEEVSVYQRFLGNVLDRVTIEAMGDFYDQIDVDDLQVMNVLFKDDSIQTSLIVGIEQSGAQITYSSNQTVYLTYTFLTEDTLQIGDIVLDVNGNTDLTTELSAVACGETAEFHILRDDQELTVSPEKQQFDGYCSFGLYLLPYSEIEETEVEYEIYDTNTGGPSGGLMQSLFIFNQLTEFDYSHGLKVGGTGTIDVDGNVGYIGGVREKIITAIGNDIDIFFVPYLADDEDDNYIEAFKTHQEFETDMILVGVSTFEEAVLYLEGYGE